jgi:hypothetical protein
MERISHKRRSAQPQQFSKTVKKARKHLSLSDVEQIKSDIACHLEEDSAVSFVCLSPRSLALTLVALS